MDGARHHRRDWSDAASRAGAILSVAWCGVAATFALDRLDLGGDLGLAAYWVAEVGGTRGLPVVIAALTLLIITRPGLARRDRIREAVVMLGALVVAVGVGAWANEHLLKPWVAAPRPNIRELCDLGVLADLPSVFYAVGDKAARSSHLAGVLEAAPLPFELHPMIRDHWVLETGFSFPSGHAFASMLVASFFLASALDRVDGRRRWLGLLAVVLAVAVCWSRPALRVHSPWDVTVGAAQGILLGLLTFVISWHLLPSSRPQPDA